MLGDECMRTIQTFLLSLIEEEDERVASCT
jgi:hypothetical protein